MRTKENQYLEHVAGTRSVPNTRAIPGSLYHVYTYRSYEATDDDDFDRDMSIYPWYVVLVPIVSMIS